MAVNIHKTQNSLISLSNNMENLLEDLRLNIYIDSDTYPIDQLLIIKFLTEARHMQNETEKE